MRPLQSNTSTFIPIWFNAWKYENEVNMIYPLLFEVRKSYKKRFPVLDEERNFFNNFIAVTEASIGVAADIALRAASKQLIDEALSFEDVQNQVQGAIENSSNNLDKILNGWANKINELHDAFENLLDSYAEDFIVSPENEKTCKSEVKFVFIIDDLDRCLPETTIAVLESIKNYLNAKNCIFVLGLNPSIIYQGISVKYQGLEIDGREYLEKILNYSFYVPEPGCDQISDFVVKRFDNLVLDKKSREKFKSQFQEFGKVLEECNFSNPRKIKRILNRYLFFLKSHEDNIDRFYNSNIVRLIILAEYFPTLFKLFLVSEQKISSLKGELEQLGLDFNIDGFEKKYGFEIKAIYPQLSRMSKIFDLNLSTVGGKSNLIYHAQQVFLITRLI